MFHVLLYLEFSDCGVNIEMVTSNLPINWFCLDFSVGTDRTAGVINTPEVR